MGVVYDNLDVELALVRRIKEENLLRVETQNVMMGLKDAFPIMISYFSIAMAFGLMIKNADLLLSDGILFSTVVFAGASQFMALNMLITGSGWISIIAATFLLNFRHFIMSASLGSRLQKPRRWQIPIIAFGVTDETFSVDMAKEGSLPPVYVISVHFFAWASWGPELLPDMFSAPLFLMHWDPVSGWVSMSFLCLYLFLKLKKEEKPFGLH